MEFSFDRPVPAEAFQKLAEQTDWAQGRQVAQIAESLRGSYLLLGVWEGDRLIGVARAISDGVYRAVIDDVIVDEPYRGRGIGTEMMRHLVKRLAHVQGIGLGCDPDQVPFYKRLGFLPANCPQLRMNNVASEGE